MANSSHRATIAVAIIGVVGTLGAALIANWDKVFTAAPQPVATPAPQSSTTAPPARPAERPPKVVRAEPTPQPVRADPAPQITGLWRDSDNPNNGTRIQQEGKRLQFTRAGILADGVRFESSGTGTLLGSRITLSYVARYQTGSTSTGECSGSVAAEARSIELSCADSLYGKFVTIASRM